MGELIVVTKDCNYTFGISKNDLAKNLMTSIDISKHAVIRYSKVPCGC